VEKVGQESLCDLGGVVSFWEGRETLGEAAKCSLTTVTSSFCLFFLISFINCFYQGKRTTVLIPRC